MYIRGSVILLYQNIDLFVPVLISIAPTRCTNRRHTESGKKKKNTARPTYGETTDYVD